MATGYLNGLIGNLKLYKGLGLTSDQILRNFNASRNRFNLFQYANDAPTGGTTTYADGYRIHTFTSSGTFDTKGYAGEIEYLIVAGGGGGGMDMGGGGGGGGVLAGTMNIAAGTYTVTVGAGGWGAPAGGGGYRGDGAGPQPNAHQFTIPATNGSNSSAFAILTTGGGAGGSSYYNYTPGATGSNGGSGGGASGYSNGSTKAGKRRNRETA